MSEHRMSSIRSGSDPTIRAIQEAVAAHFGTSLLDMCSDRRSRAVARPRQVAMYLCRMMTRHSLPAIGRNFGGRDHTTVMHAIEVVEGLTEDEEFFGVVRGIATRLAQGK